MAAHAQHESTFYSRRAVSFVAIVLVHVVLIYGLATGLAHRVIEAVAPPIQTDIVQEVQKKDVPPPPPPPQIERPPVEVPPPDISINIPVETTTSTAITDVTDKHVVAPPPPPRAVNRVGGGPGKGFPSSDDYYPTASQRLGEEGTTTIHTCIDSSGRVTDTPTVTKGSGIARIDEAAVKLAKAGSGHYRPTTEDGKPVPSCLDFRIVFKLK
ncbi:MAG TPA: energy transducer TonB [Steroidobacteraceae bacterium]|nr:energy transducer TonB [Steroidobacteraceae bacterium]